MTHPVPLPTKIFNNQKTDYDSPEIILGQDPGLFDSIHNHHPVLWDLYKRLRSMDWDENEFPYGDCLHEFETCDRQFYDMMIKTLAWQWEADATASRSILNVLAPVLTDSRVFAGYARITENECVIEGTEALTPSGWVDLKDLNVGSKVAQYNPVTKATEFVSVTDYVERDFTGQLLSFESDDALYHQVVTPGHRMFKVDRFTGKYEIETADTFDFDSDYLAPIIDTEGNETYINGGSINKSLVGYTGKVRCVSVPSGLFWVRYNNAISVTGNCLHAGTYSEIVRNSFSDPQAILDEILRVAEAQERLVTVAKVMGEAHDASHAYACGTIANDQVLYNKIFKFLIALYYLERVQFMASFAVTFALGKLGMFQPIVMAVQKIAQDEFEIHAQYGQEVIKALLKTERGQQAYADTKTEGIELFWEIIMSEVKWLVYLFSEGRELPGVTLKKMIQWVLFNGNAAGTFTGHKDGITDEMRKEFFDLTGFELEWPDKNPLPYMVEYLDISANQTSPQEIDNSQYQVNVISTVNEQAVFDDDF